MKELLGMVEGGQAGLGVFRLKEKSSVCQWAMLAMETSAERATNAMSFGRRTGLFPKGMQNQAMKEPGGGGIGIRSLQEGGVCQGEPETP